jgi:UDP-N-acetylglucosamine acyltransferase
MEASLLNHKKLYSSHLQNFICVNGSSGSEIPGNQSLQLPQMPSRASLPRRLSFARFRVNGPCANPRLLPMIHPTAIVHPEAKLDSTVQVGPYSVIDAEVEVGPDCLIGPHVYLTGRTNIGAHNQFHAGCVLGGAPQDLKYTGAPTRLVIGDHNVFREHVTVHCSNSTAEETRIGSNCYLMASCHVAHNCRLGDHIIVANGALLAGHVTVGDRVFISGNCLIHQFVRIGTLALMQGGSAIGMDLPPFSIACQENALCGLNVVGLRRAGYTTTERLELKRLYHALFRSGQNLPRAIAEARKTFFSPSSHVMLDFLAETKRGVCSDITHAASRSEDSD